MTAKTCPYLGLLKDSETMAAFPSHKNHCHFADPVEAVSMDHQLIYCLQPEYTRCMVFRHGNQEPLPADIKAFHRAGIGLPFSWRSLLIILLVLVVAGSAWWLQSGGAAGLSWLPEQSPLQPAFMAGAVPSPTPVFEQPTRTSFPTATATRPARQAPTNTPAPVETSCPYPQDWLAVTLLPEMSLESLAEAYGTRPDILMEANCLSEWPPQAGSFLFVPLPPTATPTEVPTSTNEPSPTVCSPPKSWVAYIVRPGDTLQKIASFYKLSVKDLQQANCMGRSTLIYAGSQIFVPYPYPAQPEQTWPTSTPEPLPTEMSQPPVPPANTPTIPPTNPENTPTVAPPP
jgi:LysM repeat protein